mgnify:FL=1
MSLLDAQDLVHEWITERKLGYFKPLEQLARLTEEVGELARALNQIKKKQNEEKGELRHELGDILFSLIGLANSHDVNLDDAFQETILKYNERDAERWEKLNDADPMKYWKFHNILDLKKAWAYSDLKEIAFDVLKRMPQPVGQVCGPISTGGYGSVAENMRYFNLTIQKLIEQGYSVFNQMPFEIPMQRMKEESGLPKGEANLKLLQEFYYPIFDSGLINRVYFMHNWKTSHGSRIERERAIERKISIETLPENFLVFKA